MMCGYMWDGQLEDSPVGCQMDGNIFNIVSFFSISVTDMIANYMLCVYIEKQ